MGQLLAFPCLPATSKHEPNVAIPAGLVGIHRKMLEVRGIPLEFQDEHWPTDCMLCRFSMLLSTWDSLIKLDAISYDPYRTLAAKPSRRALIRAMRTNDLEGLHLAYLACVADDGLAELQKDWDALVRVLPEQDE